MDFEFNREHERFRQEVIDFCKTEPRGETGQYGFSPSYYEKIGQKNWPGLSIPKEYGGQGLGAIYRVILMEELAFNRAPVLLYDYGVTISLLGNICLKHGSEEQKREYLPRIARGEIWCAQGYSEPEAGNDLASIQTRAVREGDHYVINGQKMWIGDARRYKYTLLMARTDPDAPLEKGISLFILDNTLPGVTIVPQPSLGAGEIPQVFLDDVQVPSWNRVGEENRGWDYYLENKPFYWNKEQGAETGTMRRIFNDVMQYTKQTERGGRLLSQDDLVRQKLARMATNIKALRYLIYRMAWMEDEGLDLFTVSALTRVFHVEVWVRFISDITQLMGLGGQLQPGSNHAPMRGMMSGLYPAAALQLMQRAGPSYIKSIIATHILGMPESQ